MGLSPSLPMTAHKFDWAGYLQGHITSPSVIVSQLHPIFGLRLACLLIELTEAGYASTAAGRGQFQILSGVRSKAHQVALYNDICLGQRRCSMVANPYHVSGTDAEGVQRAGSNHMPQAQSSVWARAWGVDRVEVGYAVDFTNMAGTSSAAWAPLHSRLARYGLDWPLKGNPVEPWHIEWFPRSTGPLYGPVAWPRRPGVHRPLFRGLIGGDVGQLQAQLNAKVDNVFGPGLEAAVRKAEAAIGMKSPNGVWTERSQSLWEAGRPDPPVNTSPKEKPSMPVNETIAVLERKVENRRKERNEARTALIHQAAELRGHANALIRQGRELRAVAEEMEAAAAGESLDE